MIEPAEYARAANAQARRDQVQRILASKTFRKKEKPGELLTAIVESEIEGRPADVRTLGVLVFGRPEDWYPTDDNIVRQNAFRLRGLLERYYATEGALDRLNIEIDGVRAIVSTNVRNPVERDMRRAREVVGSDRMAAIPLLNAVLNAEPNHAESQAAWGETEFWPWFSGWDIGQEIDLELYRGFAERSLASDPASWRGYVLLGAIQCCLHEWREAGASFSLALESSREDTQAHIWYAAYLMAVGRTDEALKLTEARTLSPLASAYTFLAHALFLYVARDYDNAIDAVNASDRTGSTLWLRYVLLYLIYIAKDPASSRAVLVRLGALTEIAPPQKNEAYPVLEHVCYTHILEPDVENYELVKGGIEDYARMGLAAADRSLPLPPDYQAVRRYQSPFQLAIGYMAIGYVQEAVAQLRKDFNRCHPMLAWLHLWPIYDPLRKEPGFAALIERMKLPPKHS